MIAGPGLVFAPVNIRICLCLLRALPDAADGVGRMRRRKTRWIWGCQRESCKRIFVNLLRLAAVESFNYLSVLLSIVLGLAITQVLLGLRRLILTRAKVKLHLPTLIWAGLALLIAIQGWWASFGLHMRTNWTFLAFFVIVLQAISTYMVAALVLPDVTRDAFVDLRDHYFAHRRWFFGALFATLVFSAAKELVLTGHLPRRTNGEFHVIFGLAAIVAALTRREWFHKLLAPALGVLFLLYSTVLFARL